MKTVIITGANGNLGSAVTTLFLEKGYRVVATVHAEQAKNDLAAHPQLEVSVVNLGHEDDTASFVKMTIEKHKTIDAALMLAGGFMAGDIAAAAGDDVKNQFSLNFETAYYLARPLFQHMMQQESGRLVFIGARPGIDAAAGKNMVAYSLSKSLLFKLAEILNAAAKGKNVTATVVVPSTIDTPVNRKSMPQADPGKWVKPRQLAEILEFICSDTASPIRETVFKVYNNS